MAIHGVISVPHEQYQGKFLFSAVCKHHGASLLSTPGNPVNEDAISGNKQHSDAAKMLLLLTCFAISHNLMDRLGHRGCPDPLPDLIHHLQADVAHLKKLGAALYVRRLSEKTRQSTRSIS